MFGDHFLVIKEVHGLKRLPTEHNLEHTEQAMKTRYQRPTSTRPHVALSLLLPLQGACLIPTPLGTPLPPLA